MVLQELTQINECLWVQLK